jgi:hypothetical protein
MHTKNNRLFLVRNQLIMRPVAGSVQSYWDNGRSQVYVEILAINEKGIVLAMGFAPSKPRPAPSQ